MLAPRRAALGPPPDSAIPDQNFVEGQKYKRQTKTRDQLDAYLLWVFSVTACNQPSRAKMSHRMEERFAYRYWVMLNRLEHPLPLLLTRNHQY